MRFFRLFLIINCFLISSHYVFSNAVIVADDTVVTVNKITLVGNKVTKDQIVMRELEFDIGSILKLSVLDSLMVKSQQNLINRSIFNFVTITRSEGEEEVDVIVKVVERWYIWPVPILQFADRNINAWIEKRDLSRINFGVDLRVDNFRGRMEGLNVILQFGYDVKAELRWSIPYLTDDQVIGMYFDGGVQLNHTIAYQTVDNKEQFFTSTKGYAQQNHYSIVGLTLRPKFNFFHGIQLGFNHLTFQDTVLSLNPDFAYEDTDYNYFSLAYAFKLDFRDYKPYPLKGYYFDVSLGKMGFGFFNKDVNRISANASFDQYIKLYHRWFFAYNVAGQISNNNQQLPYFIKSGLGYHPNNIRGYELYVVDGQQIAIFKSNVKFEILPRTTFQINWIKSTKFRKSFIALYANLFFDMSYVSDVYTEELNPMANQLLYATGVGIDIITYYDLVLRLEYSINKQGYTGFFINFVSPI